MIDLSSIILSSVISWGVNRVLDSIVECPSCHHNYHKSISNTSYNDFTCPHNNYHNSQYVNATNYTVNKNLSVVAAKIYNHHGPNWKDTFRTKYKLDVINSKYNDVVVELMLSRFRGEKFYNSQDIFKVSSERQSWGDCWFTVPGSHFPFEKCTVAIDLRVYNLYGDLLDSSRKLMEYYGR